MQNKYNKAAEIIFLLVHVSFQCKLSWPNVKNGQNEYIHKKLYFKRTV